MDLLPPRTNRRRRGDWVRPRAQQRGHTSLVIADVGESLFAAADLHVHRRFEFVSTPEYAAVGLAGPASIAAGFAEPPLRRLVVVGDGAFQMTGSELSTAVR